MRRWAGLAVRPALLAAGLIGAGLLLREVGLGDAIRQAGEHGPLAFALLGSVACSAGAPRQVVAYAGGLAFGFWAGAALSLVGETVGCVANFYWARLVGRRWVVRRLAKGGRLARLDRFLAAHAFRATLTIRLLPVGSNIVLNLLAGVSGVAAGPFVLASVIGYVPQTAVFALLGGGVRVSGAVQVGLAGALLVLSVGLGVVLLRRRATPA